MATIDMTGAAPFLRNPRAPLRRTALIAGDDLDAGSLCRVESDGLVYMAVSDAGSPEVPAEIDGFTIDAKSAGDALTLFQTGCEIDFGIAHGIAIGSFFYPSASDGALDDGAVCTGELPVAKAISTTAIIVVRQS